jgi:hypothetical protein
LNILCHSNILLPDKYSSLYALLKISNISTVVFLLNRIKILHPNNCHPHMHPPNKLKLACHIHKPSNQSCFSMIDGISSITAILWVWELVTLCICFFIGMPSYICDLGFDSEHVWISLSALSLCLKCSKFSQNITVPYINI